MIKEASTATSFIVGDVFKHNDRKGVSQWFNSPFDTWMAGFSEREIPVPNASMGFKPLKEYIFLETAFDGEIFHGISTDEQVALSETMYLQLRYALIIDPALGQDLFKYRLCTINETNYKFRVTGDKGDFMTSLCYDAEQSQWDSSMHIFGDSTCAKGSIFLYL